MKHIFRFMTSLDFISAELVILENSQFKKTFTIKVTAFYVNFEVFTLLRLFLFFNVVMLFLVFELFAT